MLHLAGKLSVAGGFGNFFLGLHPSSRRQKTSLALATRQPHSARLPRPFFFFPRTEPKSALVLFFWTITHGLPRSWWLVSLLVIAGWSCQTPQASPGVQLSSFLILPGSFPPSQLPIIPVAWFLRGRPLLLHRSENQRHCKYKSFSEIRAFFLK